MAKVFFAHVQINIHFDIIVDDFSDCRNRAVNNWKSANGFFGNTH